MEHNVISVSGGKDSTALLLLAIERQPDNLQAVFADTGNEHHLTYEYVRYLQQATGVPIRWVQADFSRKIAGKREYVLTKWAEKGVSKEAIDRAAAALVPTGVPFLDLCIWKGRFPSTKAAFCSEELKRNPIISQVQQPLLDAGDDVVSWQGVRRDESLRRRLLVENELKLTHQNGAELWNYRPILNLTAEDCFAMHRKHGINHNPLYEMGMGASAVCHASTAVKTNYWKSASGFQKPFSASDSGRMRLSRRVSGLVQHSSPPHQTTQSGPRRRQSTWLSNGQKRAAADGSTTSCGCKTTGRHARLFTGFVSEAMAARLKLPNSQNVDEGCTCRA